MIYKATFESYVRIFSTVADFSHERREFKLYRKTTLLLVEDPFNIYKRDAP